MKMWTMWIKSLNPNRIRLAHVYNVGISQFLRFLFLLFLCIFMLGFNFVQAMEQTEEPSPYPLTIFLIDGFTFRILDNYMNQSEQFSEWISNSYLGGMSMRTGGNRSVHNQLLTLATGKKQEGTNRVLTSLQGDEKWDFPLIQLENNTYIHKPYFAFNFTPNIKLSSKPTYEAAFKLNSDQHIQIINPNIPRWLQGKYNDDSTFLGEQLRKGNISREIIGNGDIDDEKRRLGALLLVDREGVIPQGTIDKSILTNVGTKFEMGAALDLYGTNYTRMQEIVEDSTAQLLVIELGDLRRQWSSAIEKDKHLLNFILWYKNNFGAKREIWILSPSLDPQSEQKAEWMTPVVRSIPGEEQGGILRSATTRQPGIIANVDIMPTILSHFNLQLPLGVEGRAFAVENGDTLQTTFLDEMKKIFHIHQLRPSLLYQVILMQVIALISTFLISYLIPPTFKWVSALGRFLLIYGLSVPLFLLILGGRAPLWENKEIHLYLIVASILFYFLTYKMGLRSLYILISLSYIVMLLGDGLLGNPLMTRSFLGYDPIIGARFYGIGNEYMGSLVGSSLLFIFLLFGSSTRDGHYLNQNKSQRWLRGIGLIVIILVILIYLGMPTGGTNAGGTLTWFIAILLVLAYYFSLKNNWRKALYVGVVLGVLFSAFIAVQYFQGVEEQTHIGRFIQLFTLGGWEAISETIMRKWEMNVRLIRVSTYSKLFVTSLILLGWFLLKPKSIKRQQKRGFAEPPWEKAFTTIVWVSLVNLLVNDSGVVAAAMSLLFAVVPLLHLVMTERLVMPQAQR